MEKNTSVSKNAGKDQGFLSVRIRELDEYNNDAHLLPLDEDVYKYDGLRVRTHGYNRHIDLKYVCKDSNGTDSTDSQVCQARRLAQAAHTLNEVASFICPNLADALYTPVGLAARTRKQCTGRAFHAFKKLPIEVQDTIWDMAFDAPVACSHVLEAYKYCTVQPGTPDLESTDYYHSPGGVWLTNGSNRALLATCKDSRSRALSMLRRDRRPVLCRGVADAEAQESDYNGQPEELMEAKLVQHIDRNDAFTDFLAELRQLYNYSVRILGNNARHQRDVWDEPVRTEHAFREVGYWDGGVTGRVDVIGRKDIQCYVRFKLKPVAVHWPMLVDRIRSTMRRYFVLDKWQMPWRSSDGPIPQAARIGMQPGMLFTNMLGVQFFSTSGMPDEVVDAYRRKRREEEGSDTPDSVME